MKFYHQAIQQISGELGAALRNIPDALAKQVLEIRLRANWSPVLTLRDKPFLLQKPILSQEQLQYLLEVLCGYSIYSWQESICKGFITLDGGHRVGIGGKVVLQQEQIIGVHPITSLNIRIARDIPQQFSPIVKDMVLNRQEGLVVAGAPASGKTTFLKQAISLLSNAEQRVCIVDERCELAAGKLPLHCDLLQNCSKAEGLLWAIRGLAPQVIVCDEIGAEEDAQAVCMAANAGARLIVSIHAVNQIQLLKRPTCKKVLDTGAFSTVIFLDNGSKVGQVKEVVEL